jgi:hypothetical protein
VRAVAHVEAAEARRRVQDGVHALVGDAGVGDLERLPPPQPPQPPALQHRRAHTHKAGRTRRMQGGGKGAGAGRQAGRRTSSCIRGMALRTPSSVILGQLDIPSDTRRRACSATCASPSSEIALHPHTCLPCRLASMRRPHVRARHRRLCQPAHVAGLEQRVRVRALKRGAGRTGASGSGSRRQRLWRTRQTPSHSGSRPVSRGWWPRRGRRRRRPLPLSHGIQVS